MKLPEVASKDGIEIMIVLCDFFPYRAEPNWQEGFNDKVELLLPLMDGWMTCDFTSFLTVFQSYQDDVWMIMKGCVQWNSVYGWEDFTSSEDRTWSARSVGQRLTHWATGAPVALENIYIYLKWYNMTFYGLLAPLYESTGSCYSHPDGGVWAAFTLF